MKKIIMGVVTLGTVYCSVLSAGTMGPLTTEYNWTGLYLGANAGYWWSPQSVNTVGTPGFINPLFPAGASAIANALAVIGTYSNSNNSDGLIGGGQVGYNYQIWDKLVVGLDADLDGLTHSNNSTALNRIVPVIGFAPETYTSTVSATRKINYLGTVRGRLGFLVRPSILVYGTGGFAYGDASYNETIIANESLGPVSYPTVVASNNNNKNRTGWVAGAGIEWMFKPQWGAKIEYSYHELNVKDTTVLRQINNLGVNPVLWGSANVTSPNQFIVEAVRLGINYHFA